MQEEYPPAADLLHMVSAKPIPVIPPGTVGLLSGEEATEKAKEVLESFNSALAARDAAALARCFYPAQSYWRDQLALTWHLRTFENASVIAASFLETEKVRIIESGLTIDGPSQLIAAKPDFRFIGARFSFTTSSPRSSCRGMVRLLPLRTVAETGKSVVSWKIWILGTWLQDLVVKPEDEALLRAPQRDLLGLKQFETDVFIIGGGNAAVALAARLKALGVESIMAERNARVGDNWALRYDSLRFHILTSICEMPYMLYDKSLQSPHRLSKDDLATHVQKYAAAFNLNIITSSNILSTLRDEERREWIVSFETPAGIQKVTCKHLVQATGFGSQIPYIPIIADTELYNEKILHSAEYKNANMLRDQGVKSVIVVGSANTAFDVVADCHAAGLQTTMNARSPTYIAPMEHVCDTRVLGIYDSLGFEASDVLLLTGPTVVSAALSQENLAHLASEEPDRYAGLAKAGFDAYDSSDPKASLMSSLLSGAGGHYVDVGVTNLLAEAKVAVKARAEPVAFTPTGLEFSDGTTLDADAVIWCTGFQDKNARTTAAEILGGAQVAVAGDTQQDHVLGPADIAARLDATWGVDSEGEVRGMWKRHLRIDNYWVMGGFTQQHRWYSRMLALQIKADLEGILPPAYRETPEVVS